MEGNRVQYAESVGLAHSLLLHHVANRNKNLLLVSVASLWHFSGGISCLFFCFTSLIVSEGGHSHMGGSDVVSILAFEALLYFRLLLNSGMSLCCPGIINNIVNVGPL